MESTETLRWIGERQVDKTAMWDGRTSFGKTFWARQLRYQGHDECSVTHVLVMREALRAAFGRLFLTLDRVQHLLLQRVQQPAEILIHWKEHNVAIVHCDMSVRVNWRRSVSC